MKMKKHHEEIGLRSLEPWHCGGLLLVRRLMSALLVALLLGTLCPSTLVAGSIGVNFNSSTVTDVDPVTGSAGVVPQSNWNNTQSQSGSVASGSVIDDSGATVSGMSVSWSADAAHSVGSTDATSEGDDTALMHGGLEEHHTTYGTGFGDITMTGIPYARYNLYIYINGWNASSRDGEIQLLVGGSVVAGSQRQFLVMGTDFIDGSHSHSESTGTADEGTYVLWENLTASNLTAQVRKISDNPLIVGFQIVEVAVPDIAEQNIGVNFNASNPAHVDLVTATSGAVPQGNWNNVSNATGSVTGAVLEDSGAILEGMSISWNGSLAFSVGNASGTGEGDDTALMHGGIEVFAATYGTDEITLTGIPYVEYDIYLYVNGWNTSDRDGEAQLKVGGSVIAGSQRQFDAMGTEFIDGTHTHSESTGITDEGTYVLWEDVTSADLVVQLRYLDAATRPIITGLQLVKTPPDGTMVSIR
jgi:hypothetical protein